jgi:AP2 domain
MQWDDTVPEGAVRIPLRARDGSVRAYTIVDAADADWVNQWQWGLETGYAGRGETRDGRKQTFRLHRELLGLVRGDGVEGDHRNLNKLDNRRKNLRVVSKHQNRQNKPSNRGSSSQYRGVTWNKTLKKWQAYVSPGGKYRHLGLFHSEEDAAQAARKGRAQYLPYSED